MRQNNFLYVSKIKSNLSKKSFKYLVLPVSFSTGKCPTSRRGSAGAASRSRRTSGGGQIPENFYQM